MTKSFLRFKVKGIIIRCKNQRVKEIRFWLFWTKLFIISKCFGPFVWYCYSQFWPRNHWSSCFQHKIRAQSTQPNAAQILVWIFLANFLVLLDTTLVIFGCSKTGFGPSFGPSVSPYSLWNIGMWIFNSKLWKFAPKIKFSYCYIGHICHNFHIASLQTLSCSCVSKSNAIFERYD